MGCGGLVMEAGTTPLIHGLPDSVVVPMLLPMIESLRLKSELSYTLGSLLILNKTWNTFIQARGKFIELQEEWQREERRWVLQNFHDAMPDEAFSD